MTHLTHPKDVIQYCPKCGSNKFKSNDIGKSFRCEECKFIYFINSSAAVACLIITSDGKLLLTRRAIEPAKGMLDLPGGFVEPMERVEDAIKREIGEELGVNITDAKFLVSFPNEYIYSDFSVFTLDLAFICTVDDMSKARPADDVSAIEFVFPDKIRSEELCSKSIGDIIEFYINSIK